MIGLFCTLRGRHKITDRYISFTKLRSMIEFSKAGLQKFSFKCSLVLNQTNTGKYRSVCIFSQIENSDKCNSGISVNTNYFQLTRGSDISFAKLNNFSININRKR